MVHADVSLVEGARTAFQAASERLGRIDVLFNHAGIILVKPFLDGTIEEGDELMDNNAKSAFLMTRLVLPQMLERGKGTLVFTPPPGSGRPRIWRRFIVLPRRRCTSWRGRWRSSIGIRASAAT